MHTYISLLRGINVSGQRLIKMEALRALFSALEFNHVTTYLQSGNVVFTTGEQNSKVLEQLIARKIHSDFGFEVPVIVMKAEAFATIVEANPLAKDTQKDSSFLHVTFLSEPPVKFDKELLFEKKQTEEEIEFTADAIYLYCPGGYGRTKLTNTFLEAKLNVSATTRNWKTSTALLELSKNLYAG
jgi:uncharacterized protein (DUF1697 family)